MLYQPTHRTTARSTWSASCQGPSVLDRLGFEGAVEGLGHRVVVTVGDRADRRGRAGLDQALAVANGHVLTGFNQSSQHFDQKGVLRDLQPVG